MYNEETLKKVEGWEKKPSNLDDYMEALANFQLSMFREEDPQKFGQDFISYLIMESVIYNITEENYFDEKKTDEVFVSLAKALKDTYKGNKIKLPDSYEKFFVKFRDVIDDYPLYTREINLEKFDNLKVKITDPYRGKNRVSSKKSSFLVDTDTIFSDPKLAKKFLEKIDNVIDDLKPFDKFCFIEKRKGPIGPSALMAYLTSKHNIESAVYRPRHITPLARISGCRIEKGDTLCLVYDLSFSGEGLKEAALELKRAFNADPKYAVVLADLKQGAKETLEKVGVKLRPVFEISEKDIKDAWYEKYGIDIDKKLYKIN